MVNAVLIGVDPGITTGIAVLDLHGNLLILTSKRDVRKSDVIKLVTKFGRPLVVATDRNPLPRSIEKLASTLGSKVYFPEISLSVVEKQELTKEFKEMIKNDHESDALAASIKAWKSYRELFSRVEQTLQELGLTEFFEDVAKNLLQEESDNIDDAINEVVIKKRRVLPEIVAKKPLTLQDYERVIKELETRLHKKEQELENSRQESIRLNAALMQTRKNIKNLEKIQNGFDELNKLKIELEELKNANEMLKKFKKIEDDGFLPVIEVSSISGSRLENLNDKIGLENRILFSDSTENLNILNRFGLKALLVKELPSTEVLKKMEFPVIVIKSELQNFNGIKAIKKDDLEDELKEAKKSGLIEWLKGYRERKL